MVISQKIRKREVHRMEQAIKPSILEGKKKFTATLTMGLIGFVGLLVTTGIIGEQTAEPIVQMMSLGLPLALAFVYDVMQGLHDRKKEDVAKVIVEQRFLLEKEKIAPPVSLPKPKPINFRAFTEEVLERVETDKTGRPKGISLYYAIIGEGKETETQIPQDV